MVSGRNDMIFDVNWTHLDGIDDDRGDSTRVLYGYKAPRGAEILYIGMAHADSSSVHNRLSGEHKRGWFERLEREREIREFRVMLGEVFFDGRFTREMLADIESLLIYRLQPWGNRQSRVSRISRPGMIVRCSGRAWSHPQREFRDVG